MSNEAGTCPRTEQQPGSWEDGSRQQDTVREIGHPSGPELTMWALENLTKLWVSRAKCRQMLSICTWLPHIDYLHLVRADAWYLAGISVLSSLTVGDVGDPEQPHIRRNAEKVSKEGGQLSRNWASCHESSMPPAETQENVQTAGFSSWGSQHASIRKPWAPLPSYSLSIKIFLAISLISSWKDLGTVSSAS